MSRKSGVLLKAFEKETRDKGKNLRKLDEGDMHQP